MDFSNNTRKMYKNTVNLIVALILVMFNKGLLAQELTAIQPKDAAFVHVMNPTFSWNVSAMATGYVHEYTSDPTFTVGLISSAPLSVTSYTVPSIGFGVWYWRVRATTASGDQYSPVYLLNVYDPSQDPNLSLWLKADQGITLDGSSNVQSWTDQSPNGFGLAQSTPGKRPFVSNNILNGYPAVIFSGGQVLDGGDILDIRTNSRSMFIIGRMGGNNQALFAKTLAAFASSRYGILNDAGQSAFIYHEGAPSHVYSPINSFQYSMYSIVSSRTALKNKMELNNVSLGQSNLQATYDMNSNYRFLVGAYNNATDNGELLNLNGGICEIVFSNTDDSTLILKNEAYLRYKYAPPVDLGKDSTLVSFCNYTLSAGSGFSNFLWSTGATTSSIFINQSGTYWAQATDRFGYVSRDSVIIQFPSIPTAGVIGICAGQSVTWNADMGPGWTYLWSTGETTPSITFSTPGTYFVTVTDPFGCSKTSDPAIFGIDNYETTAFLGNDTSLCSGNQVALQVGSLETLEYYWNGDMSSGQQANFIVSTTGEVTLESINVNGCVAQDTIQVTVSGIAPSADFSFTDLCGSETGTFTDLSVPSGSDPIATWSWDMGDLTNETTQNVSHSYLTPGVYTVQLYVESAGGCGDLHIETLTVFDPPVSSFTVSGHCEDQQVDFASTSTAGDAAITTYSWKFDMPASGAYNFSAIPIPNRIFPDAATYNVSLVVSDANGCQDSLAIPLVIDPSAAVDFNYSLACADSTIQLTDASSTLPGSSYNWSWPGGSSILQNTSTVFGISGSYDVTLAVGNTFGCTSTLTKTIVVHPLPLLFLDFGPHCAGTYMNASAVTAISSGSVDSVQWLFNGTGLTTGFDVDYLVQQTGQLEVLATAYSDQGCSASVGQNLDVISELDVTFTPLNGTAGAGDIFQFDNTSTGTNVALWNFGDGQFSSVFDATHVYDEQYIDSVMNVYLIGLNTEGCMDTAYGQITVQRPYMDLALEEVFVQADGAWQIVGVRMRNAGSVNVASADLWIETRAGRLVQETWTGLLAPGEDSIYIFTGKIQSFISDQDERDDFVCVSGLGYDLSDGLETDLSNNTTCKDVEGEEAVLLPVYPNPASGSINVSLLISKEETVDLYLTDAIGQRVAEIYKDQQLGAGYYQETIDLQTLRSGIYFIRLISEGQDISEKILINN